MGQGDTLFETSVAEILPGPEIAHETILIGYLAAFFQLGGQLDKEPLLVAGGKVEADQSFIYQRGEHWCLLAPASPGEVMFGWSKRLTPLLFRPTPLAEIGDMCPLLEFCVNTTGL
ncbi:hypothetical protein D3C85_1534530 [compost metagenome]